jgi:hypothetical protein
MSDTQPIAAVGFARKSDLCRTMMYPATSAGITELHLQIYVCVREIGVA